MDQRIVLQGREFTLNGQPIILYGGEFQYFRIPRHLWESSLKKLKEASFNLISFYIPWIWHEVDEDLFDFTGETLPERDLRSFLALCRELDFYLAVRPGPYIYAEYQGFGVPEWLRARYPEILRQMAPSKPVPEVSLNHPTFLEKTRNWFANLLPELQGELDAGRVAAWQLDNETGLPQYGNRAWDIADYNPDTVTRYVRYLQDHFGDLETLNQTWDSSFQTWDQILPPTKSHPSRLQVWRWAQFIEDYIVEYLHNLKGMWQELGINPFFYHNVPQLLSWPNQAAKKAQVSTVGYDIYSKATTAPAPHDLPYSNSLAPELFASLNPDRPVIAAELGCGWFDPDVLVKPEATLQQVMGSIVRDCNMVSYYIIQDAIEADGTPWEWAAALNKEGQVTPRYDVVKQVGEFAKKEGTRLRQSQQIRSPIAILSYVPHTWIIHRPPDLNLWRALDIEGTESFTHFLSVGGLFGLLAESGYNPAVLELQTSSLHDLRQYKVLLLNSIGVLDDNSHQKLIEFVRAGGLLITAGQPPTRDHLNRQRPENPLYPAEPYGVLNHSHYGTTQLISRIAVDIVSYQWSRRRIQHRLSLATMDMIRPYAELLKSTGKTGTWLETARGDRFWGTRFTSTWRGSGITPVLRLGNKIAGYSVRHGHGRSVFLGTLPGAFYDTPAYYTKSKEKKSSVVDFFTDLLKEAGIRPLTEPAIGIETVMRKTDDGMYVFLFNRGHRQNFKLPLHIDKTYRKLETVFAGKESHVDKHPFYDQLSGTLDEDDVLGIYLS